MFHEGNFIYTKLKNVNQSRLVNFKKSYFAKGK